MLRAGHRHEFEVLDAGEALLGLGRPEVVVVLGDQGDQPLAGLGPDLQVCGRGEAQRWRQQDRPDHSWVVAVHQRQIGAERPADEPDRRQICELGVLDGGRHVQGLAPALVEGALTGALDTPGAAGIEPEYRDPGERRQPECRLAEDVAVHHPAVGRQRMKADHGRDRGTFQRDGQLPHESQCVAGLERERRTPCGQDRVGTDLGGHD